MEKNSLKEMLLKAKQGKYAYFNGFKKYFEQNPKDHNPLKLNEFAEKEIREAVKTHLNLFGAVNMA